MVKKIFIQCIWTHRRQLRILKRQRGCLWTTAEWVTRGGQEAGGRWGPDRGVGGGNGEGWAGAPWSRANIACLAVRWQWSFAQGMPSWWTGAPGKWARKSEAWLAAKRTKSATFAQGILITLRSLTEFLLLGVIFGDITEINPWGPGQSSFSRVPDEEWHMWNVWVRSAFPMAHTSQYLSFGWHTVSSGRDHNIIEQIAGLFDDSVDILFPFFMVTVIGFEEALISWLHKEDTWVSLIEFDQCSGLPLEYWGNTQLSSALCR